MTRATHGFVLVTTLFIALALALLIAGFGVTTILERMVSANQRTANAAFHLAEAGLQQYRLVLFKNLVAEDGGSLAGWCEPGGLTALVDENGNTILNPGDTTDWIALGDGRYRVTYDVTDQSVVFTSVAEAGGAQATAQLVAAVGAGPSRAWDNALFASGEAATAKAINGNASIHGGVHIIDAGGDVYALTGNAGIFNYYPNDAQLITAMTDILPPAFGGLRSIDLCTRVKIARGNLHITGNAQLGDTNEPIRSLHMHPDNALYDARPHNRTGQPTSDPITSTPHRNIHIDYPSDGTVYSPYASFELDMPQLPSDYPNEGNAFDVFTSNGTPAPGCEWLFNGAALNLPPNRSTNASCGTSPNTIEWITNDGPAYLRVNGYLNFNNATLNVAHRALVRYEGDATFRFGTNPTTPAPTMTFQGVLAPRGSSAAGATGTFPNHNALAIITTGDITFDITAANKTPFAALIYSTGNVIAQKQFDLVGSIVADTFDLGNNVPTLMHHPDLPAAAERLCLPGTFCATGTAGINLGRISDISIQRR